MPAQLEQTFATFDQATDPRVTGQPDRQLVTFQLGEEEFGVEILAVRDINRLSAITHVPEAPPHLAGVVNLRGKVIPVMDLRSRLGMPTTEPTKDSRIVAVEVHGLVLGLLVDRVRQVMRISSQIIEPAPTMASGLSADYIEGVGKLPDRLLILLNLGRLFDQAAARQAAAGVSDAVEPVAAGE